MLIPLPFVATLLLCILLYRLHHDKKAITNNRLFTALIVIYSFGTFLMGLRWSYNITAVASAMAIVGASVPIMAWLSFSSLARSGPELDWRRDARHLLPIAVLVVVIVGFPVFIDHCILVIYGIYCVALIRLASQGPEQLKLAKFEHMHLAYKALCATAAALVLFAALDVLIMADFAINKGEHVPVIVNAVYVPMVFLLSFFTAAVSQSRSSDMHSGPWGASSLTGNSEQNSSQRTDESKQPGQKPDPSDEQLAAANTIMQCLEQLMSEQKLYRDENLNLALLARKCGRPSREVSAAVNQFKGINISQYVNGFRVEELSRLLQENNKQITELQYEVGFQTRSNCIREFKRIKGCSPTQWRESKQPN